jgi:hypothetical protein
VEVAFQEISIPNEIHVQVFAQVNCDLFLEKVKLDQEKAGQPYLKYVRIAIPHFLFIHVVLT